MPASSGMPGGPVRGVLRGEAVRVAQFRAPHEESADTTTAWGGLEEHLDPDRWSSIS